MDFIFNALLKEDALNGLINAVKCGGLPAAVSGLTRVHKAAAVAAAASETKRKTFVVCPDEASATEMCEDINRLGVKALVFPQKDVWLNGSVNRSNEYEQIRLNTLSKILDGDFGVVLASAAAAAQLTVPFECLKQNSFNIAVNCEIKIEELSKRLTDAGYVYAESVEGAGQFSVRGGIVDVFPPCYANPYRIEFWGDTVDTVSAFETSTQRRTNTVDSIKIIPAAEVVFNAEDLVSKLSKHLESGLSAKRINVVSKDIELINAGIFNCSDRYLTAIYRQCTLLDYMREDDLCVICESSAVAESLKAAEQSFIQENAVLLEEGITDKTFYKTSMDSTEFYGKLSNCIYLENFETSNYPANLKNRFAANIKRMPPWQGEVKVLKEDIEYTVNNGGTVVVLAGGEKQTELLFETLKKSFKAVHLLSPDYSGALPKGISLVSGALSAGMAIPQCNFMLVAAANVTVSKPRKQIKNENAIGSLDELSIGDYVVHVSHGIGIFAGIHKITANGVTKDYIKINYAKTDVLYVPVTQLDLISKYIGASENGTVKLNKLGSGEWQKTRARVKHAAKDMAKQLTALYAKRMSQNGYAFCEDTELQAEFERGFAYVETEDQIRCIKEIKRDMQSQVPMDRLLCGDVGFGKTEVALRAAFKCVSEGRQCALLVPTTILAWQHYNTVIKRFGELPVTVKMLSRFVSAAEQKKTVKLLAAGKVDMVIGTHRLISSDVAFKNLGLLIVDEEQRFGVEQKEKLKEKYPLVDVLTLSATPIPRTLNMAMSGLRDMSCIEEAPGDRLPVQTYVLQNNSGIMLDAIRRELRRNGQVYYLHNRVESIIQTAAKLKEAMPDARIDVAHGKMGEDELSRVWQRLLEHETDVLVCTTIIETGVDVPNVNTLIIDDADRFGLSQLHQLRGRVGRSSRRAYAYFFYKGGKVLNEVAEKRLEAIREFTEFGAGFKIAMRDLEIRGAGNILGGEQHGNMESVGYDMYIKLLNEAINEEKGIIGEASFECSVDIAVSAFIPESYIKSVSARLGIYKRIAAINSNETKEDVIDELCDRFGEPPKAVMGLIFVALLRNKAAALGVYEISEEGTKLKLKVKNITENQVQKITDAFPRRMVLCTEEPMGFVISPKPGQKKTDLIADIAAAL